MTQETVQPVQDVTVGGPRRLFEESPSTRADLREAVRPHEIAMTMALVVLSDLVIYRGHGFGGYGVLFGLAPFAVLIGAGSRRGGWVTWLIGTMLAILALKTAWCGSGLLVGAGFALVVAFAMALSGQCPYVPETIVFGSQTITAGYRRLVDYGQVIGGASVVGARVAWLSLLLPLAALVVFGMIFVLANPDWLESFSVVAEQLVRRIREWLVHFSIWEIWFWCAVFWLSAGLLRPLAGARLDLPQATSDSQNGDVEPVETPLYPAFRNTLVVVIGLFAVYLVFEFRRLWFREFPKGFHYSGFAHQGAAWLTFALALATLLLSLVFRGGMLRDPRLQWIKQLAWLWSVENFILAVAVYHRLWIYIGFNGMTRMRMVGIFGTTTVVAGFILVLCKIARHYNFVWLLRGQLWVLAMAVYLYAVTPVDAIVVSYNVRRILAGDPAPSVEISVHPISSEGVLLLRPLMMCEDAIIREGVRAMLAQRHEEAESQAARRESLGWTAFQLADQVVLCELRNASNQWTDYRDAHSRAPTLKAFHRYAYQWY